MTRLASNPACGPAASSSEPTEPAFAAFAPEESAPEFDSEDCCSGGGALGFLCAHPALPTATASIRTISTFCIPLHPCAAIAAIILLTERTPDGLADCSLIRLQSQSRQTIHRHRGEHPATAILLGVDQRRAV